MTEQKKRALILSTFTDAGTGETFTKGDTPTLTHGQFGNYEAAGLASTPPATTAKPKPPARPKSAKKPSPKARPAATPSAAPARTETASPPADA